MQHDHRGDDFAPLLVADADDRALPHGRVLEEHVFDLAGREVLAAAHDDVVEPTLDVEVPALVEVALVVGGEPSFTRPAVVLAVVLARHLLAAHPDLAVLRRPSTSRRPRSRTVISTVGNGWPTEPRRWRTCGSSLASALRWSSGVSTAIDELVSVSP